MPVTSILMNPMETSLILFLLNAQKYSIWLNISFLLIIFTPFASVTPHSSTYSSSISFSGSSSSYQLNVIEPRGLNSGSLLLRGNKSIVVKRMDSEAKLSGFESYLLLT